MNLIYLIARFLGSIRYRVDLWRLQRKASAGIVRLDNYMMTSEQFEAAMKSLSDALKANETPESRLVDAALLYSVGEPWKCEAGSDSKNH